MERGKISMSIAFAASENPDPLATLLKALGLGTEVFCGPGQNAFEVLPGVLFEFYADSCGMPDYLESGVLITLAVENLDQALQVAIQNEAKVLFFFLNGPNDYGACHLRLKNGMVIGFLQRGKTAME